MVGIGVFRGFMRTRLNIEPDSPIKPTKVGFILILGLTPQVESEISQQLRDTNCRQS